MNTSEQMSRAVEALVRLQFAQEGETEGDTHMDLDSDENSLRRQQLYEAKVSAAQEYCLRILG
ncbi:hypothetical protein BGZ94_002114, partial [Podila epigama]